MFDYFLVKKEIKLMHLPFLVLKNIKSNSNRVICDCSYLIQWEKLWEDVFLNHASLIEDEYELENI